MDDSVGIAATAQVPGLAALADDASKARIDRRSFLRRAAALGVSAPAAAAILAACGSSTPSSGASGGGSPSSSVKPAAPGGKKGGTLTFGPFADGEDYDPATNNFDFPNPPFPSIFEGMTAYVPGQPAGSPAQNLLAETVEASPDGRQYHFTLKQGVEFHGGYGEMTAADVKYSWERNAGLIPLYPGAPKSQTSYYAGDFAGLQEVKVTGKYTCTAVFKQPFVPFETITLPWTTSGYIFPQAAVLKYGSLWGHHPIGTGPYEVVSYTPQSKMVLRKFPNYSGANEKLGAKNWYDEIVINMVPLNALPKGVALTVGLQSGQVDFTYNLGALDVNRLRGNSGFRTYEPLAPLDYYFIAIDVQNPKLKDVRVRQAIRLALNIPEIITANKLPLSTRQNSLINKQLGVGYWADAPTYTQDVKQAKSLLAAAGVTSLDLQLANPLLAETPGEPSSAMQVIKANLAQVGINVTIIETPPTSYVSKAGFGGLAYSYYGGAPDPYYQFEWFTCSQIGVWNYASWCNPTYSSDENKIASTSDTAQRDAIAIEMQKLMDQDCSYVWLSSAINFAASNSKTQAIFDRNGNPLLHYFYST